MTPRELAATIEGLRDRARRGDRDGAVAAAEAFARRVPGEGCPQALLGELLAQQGKLGSALAAFEEAIRVDPGVASHRLGAAQVARSAREFELMRKHACEAERLADSDAKLLGALGDLYLGVGDHCQARRLYCAAADADPDDPRHVFNRGVMHSYFGKLDDAQTDYDLLAERHPRYPGIWWNRSELRRWTAERNHVRELESLLRRDRSIPTQINAGFALAKELEDLGRHQESWSRLTAAAALQRAQFTYNVEVDVETIDAIISADASGRSAGFYTDEPIFIVGMPRTGTTLVDRIIGAHSQVQSAGELPHLSLALGAAVRSLLGRLPKNRQESVAASTELSPAALGRDYLDRTRPLTGRAPHFTDKLPLNHLYCGLISKALPKARIVLVTRDPLATAYAVFKTLFGQAYPFSYDLRELTQYIIAYEKLVKHWRKLLGDALYEVTYEELVKEPEREISRLLNWLGLPTEGACFAPHASPEPVMTASAGQVRVPIHQRSIELWRHHATALAPVAESLRKAGVIREYPGEARSEEIVEQM